MKLQAVMLHSDDFAWLAYCLQHFFEVHIKSKVPDRLEYFRKFALFTEFLFILEFILYCCAVIIFFLFPFYMYFFQSKLIPIIPIFIPFLDENTIIGYTILVIIQTYFVISALLGLLSYDYFNSVLFTSSLMYAKLIRWEMDAIHIEMQDNATKWRVNGRLRNLLQMHQEIFE